uniref:SAP domain-containing protein n=1 Tax=Macrostomum lignano TaxID=282301 RepID=A0A1I8H6H8_9PLAT
MFGGHQKTAMHKSVYGTVTKMFGNFGYVDDEIFFLREVVSGVQPRAGDHVFVSANYTPNMPIKWNADRLEVRTKQHHQPPPPPPPSRHRHHQQQQPPPMPSRRDAYSNRGYGRSSGGNGVKREASSSRHQPSTSSNYAVSVPTRLFALPQFSVMDLRQRYPRLYLPSDFYHVSNTWLDEFPIDQPFQLGRHCAFHIFPKEVDSLDQQEAMNAAEPADQDYRYCAKVMLLASPPLDQLYSRTCALAHDTAEVRNRCTSVQRNLQFLCGISGGRSGEPLALGGPWSPSMDGEDPEGDPEVLINTAVRHVKRLIGVDLSGCTNWCKFMEYRYFRTGRPDKQRPPAEETVVVYLPDVWSLMPGGDEEWQVRCQAWEDRLELLLEPPKPPTPPPSPEQQASKTDGEGEGEGNNDEAKEAATGDKDETGENQQQEMAEEESSEQQEEMETAASEAPTKARNKGWRIAKNHQKSEIINFEMKSLNPADLPGMKVPDLRRELELRGLSNKGLKAQLIARLEEALQKQQQEEQEKEKQQDDGEQKKSDEKAKTDDGTEASKDDAASAMPAPPPPPKELTEAEKDRLRRMHKLPDAPALFVTPSRTARNGRLDCQLIPLAQLLAYRLDASREHTFEVSMFAEQFNDMLSRDCAFNISAALERKAKSLRTFRPDLLLSFVYFDRDRAGYLLCRDLEDLLHGLGTLRSRYQARRLAELLAASSSATASSSRRSSELPMLRYRCLTDFAEEPAGEGEDDDDAMKAEILVTGGNRDLLSATAASASVAVVSETGESAAAVLRRAKQERDDALRRLSAAAAQLTEAVVRLAAGQSAKQAATAEVRQLRDTVRNLKREEAAQRSALADHRRLVRATADVLERARQPLFDLFDKKDAAEESAAAEDGATSTGAAAAV